VKILICGGGTGGHIYPAVSIVNSLVAEGLSKDDMLWIGTHGQIEEMIVPRSGLVLETISGGPIAGVPWPTKIDNFLKLLWSMGKVNRIMAKFAPDVTVMTGGYVNFPVGITARLRRIPIAIFLPDIEPGLAIRTLSHLATVVACTTEKSVRYFKPGKTVITGYPVRSELRQASELSQLDALGQFQLGSSRPTLFVFGGSRGARSINRALMANLDQLLQEIQIIHISGTLDWDEVREHAEKLEARKRDFYRPFAYLDQKMGSAYRAADLVLARAGASMLGECPAFGTPTILVPYPYAWRYQMVNAEFLVDGGAAILLKDEQLQDRMKDEILNLIQDEARLARMSAAARSLDVPDAPSRLSRLLLDLGKGLVQ